MSHSFAETLSLVNTATYTAVPDDVPALPSSEVSPEKYSSKGKFGEQLKTCSDDVNTRNRVALLSLLYFEF